MFQWYHNSHIHDAAFDRKAYFPFLPIIITKETVSINYDTFLP